MSEQTLIVAVIMGLMVAAIIGLSVSMAVYQSQPRVLMAAPTGGVSSPTGTAILQAGSFSASSEIPTPPATVVPIVIPTATSNTEITRLFLPATNHASARQSPNIETSLNEGEGFIDFVPTPGEPGRRAYLSGVMNCTLSYILTSLPSPYFPLIAVVYTMEGDPVTRSLSSSITRVTTNVEQLVNYSLTFSLWSLTSLRFSFFPAVINQTGSPTADVRLYSLNMSLTVL